MNPEQSVQIGEDGCEEFALAPLPYPFWWGLGSVFLNGVPVCPGRDYELNERRFHWIGGFELKQGDLLLVIAGRLP